MGNPAVYGASKGALNQFVRWLSTTSVPLERVSTICPRCTFRYQPNSFVRQYELRTPVARIAKEEDFKGSLGFLVSDLSSCVTGQSLNDNGGWSALYSILIGRILKQNFR
jgi:NAD(P)-dependent dehydrogenase (short-subunit alcohol dehydrogenase family)